VSDRVAVGLELGVAAADGDGLDDGGVVAAGLGEGEAPARVAHAFVSCVSTMRQTDFAVASHAVPSAAVREKDTRTNG
jgi:hypothetical protein